MELLVTRPLEEAVVALDRAAHHEPPAYPWSVAWFTARVNAENGYLDEAIAGYRTLVDTRFQDAREREFDFGQDYRLLNELAITLFERAQQYRPESPEWERDLRESADWYGRTLEIDPENAPAHYGLAQIWARLGDAVRESTHRQLHDKYRVDDNARDRAVRLAREKNPAADHSADAVVLYDLQRPEAYELRMQHSDQDTAP